jgi:hypothetical protein
MKRYGLFLVLAILSSPLLAGAQKSKPSENRKAHISCLESVEKFYHWYSSLSPLRSESRFTQALRVKPTVFEPSLLRLAKRDSEAQKKATPEAGIVGLDFDPFLYDSDPAEHFKMRELRRTGTRCLVSVRSDVSGEVAQPELILGKQGWRVVNVHYLDNGKNSDLVGVLKEWELARQSIGEKHP